MNINMRSLASACATWKRKDPSLAVAARRLNLPEIVLKVCAEDAPESELPAGTDIKQQMLFISDCIARVRRRDTELYDKIMHYINTETAAGRESRRLQTEIKF